MIKLFVSTTILFACLSTGEAVRLIHGVAPSTVKTIYHTHFGYDVCELSDAAAVSYPQAELRYLGYQSNRFLPFFTPNGFKRNSYQWGITNTGDSNVLIFASSGVISNTEPGVAGIDMNLFSAWPVASSWTGIVAVLDTGVVTNHPDLTSVLPGVTIQFLESLPGGLTNGQNDVHAAAGHGSFIAGLISANGSTNNDGHIRGVAPHTKILPIATDLSLPALLIGIDYAVTSGARIITCAWGFPGEPEGMRDAVSFAQSNGVILACSAPNQSIDLDADNTDYPIAFRPDLDNVIGITSINADGTVSADAAYGFNLIGAPGRSLASIGRPSYASIVYGNGTSFAMPNAVGVMALTWANHPDASHQEIIGRLIGFADHMPTLAGRVNAARTVGPVPDPCPSCPIIRPAFQPLIAGGMLMIPQAGVAVIDRSTDLITWTWWKSVVAPISIPLDLTAPKQFYRVHGRVSQP